MEDGGLLTPALSFSEFPMDLDLMDDLFYEGCWVEATTDGFDLCKANSSNTAVYPLLQHQNISLEESDSDPRIMQQEAEFQARYLNPDDGSRGWWIPPNPSSGPYLVKQKLMEAVRYLNESTKDKDVLIQIWVPVQKEGRNVLTTIDQPYTLQKNSRSLETYRNVSEDYEFAAEQNSQKLFGLPGRVFMGQVPEWTPDVQLFKPEEYPRVKHALECDIRGSLALPVFERGSKTCLGVIEIATTSKKIHYRPELDSICKALEAVDLSSSQSFTSSSAKASTKLYQAELTRVRECITSICKAYRLPLALTWASCAQQGKEGSRHSNENYEICVSTVDSACFVSDPHYYEFHEACSEHHLLRDQGIVGKAFVTNKLQFATDITECSKTEYPLSHHARVFELTSAVAIPLVSSYSGMADFVLEFFLPKDCKDAEKQDMMLSLSRSLLWEFQNCRVPVSPTNDSGITSVKIVQQEESERLPKQLPESESWISNIMEAQQKGKRVGVSFNFGKVPKEEFKVISEWENTKLPGKMFQQNFESKPCVEVDAEDESLLGRFDLVGDGKSSGQRRRTKTEKTISLEVLRQYFAGSLKDAAKSLGVCPTTLKRICRQHGINRWPSRKIKKVGHSLKKLQLVMDSVRGAEGSIQITSFYKSFPELNHNEIQSVSSKFSDPSSQLLSNNMMPFEAAAEKSPSSSCTHSTSSTTSCSTGSKQDLTATAGPNCGDSHSILWEDPSVLLKRTRSDVELHVSTLEEPQLLTRSHSQKTLNEHLNLEALPPLPNAASHISREGIHRVKVTYEDENIRFSLQGTSTFRDLQEEIMRRFSIEDINRVDLKYLDDDDEWVLLTCDADLEECVDVYRMSHGRNTIRISVHQWNSNPGARSSFGSSNISQNHNHLQ